MGIFCGDLANPTLVYRPILSTCMLYVKQQPVTSLPAHPIYMYVEQRPVTSIPAHPIYMYVEQQPVTSIPIQHVMRWPDFDAFGKTHKRLFLIRIYNAFIFCVCKN